MTKPTKWHVRPAKTQISLGICPVWSEYLQSPQWLAKDPNLFHADSEDSVRLGRCPGWSVFAGRTCHFVGFVMRWHIYPGLSAWMALSYLLFLNSAASDHLPLYFLAISAWKNKIHVLSKCKANNYFYWLFNNFLITAYLWFKQNLSPERIAHLTHVCQSYENFDLNATDGN